MREGEKDREREREREREKDGERGGERERLNNICIQSDLAIHLLLVFLSNKIGPLLP